MNKIVSFSFKNELYVCSINQLISSTSHYIIEMSEFPPFLLFLRDSGIWGANNPDIDNDLLQVIGSQVMLNFSMATRITQ